jgi:hypothetical protein
MSNSKTLPAVKGNPSSAQPMRGLSKRAQKLLAPKRQCFCTPIEPAGSGLVRFAKSKAAI